MRLIAIKEGVEVPRRYLKDYHPATLTYKLVAENKFDEETLKTFQYAVEIDERRVARVGLDLITEESVTFSVSYIPRGEKGCNV